MYASFYIVPVLSPGTRDCSIIQAVPVLLRRSWFGKYMPIPQDLEQQAISGGDLCEPICVDGAVGIIVGIFGDRCKEVPCPDVRSTELLVQYDASQQALDLFGVAVTVDPSMYEADVDTVLNQATSTISVLVERINFASSCYVLYLAFLVVFPATFVVYR